VKHKLLIRDNEQNSFCIEKVDEAQKIDAIDIIDNRKSFCVTSVLPKRFSCSFAEISSTASVFVKNSFSNPSDISGC